MTAQVVTARVDKKVWEQAKFLAQQNGLTLNAIINLKLREFVANKQISLSYTEPEFEIDFGNEGIDAQEVVSFLQQHT